MDFVKSHFFTNEPQKVPQIEEKSVHLVLIRKEVTSYKIHTLKQN